MELLWRPLLLRAWTSLCKNWQNGLCVPVCTPHTWRVSPPNPPGPAMLYASRVAPALETLYPRRSRWYSGCSDRSDDTDLFKWQTGQQQYLIRSQSCGTSHGKATAYRSSCIIEAALILGGTACSLRVHAHQHAHWTEAEAIRRGSRW